MTWFCLTGDGQGEVLADDGLLSTSSGRSTDPVRRPRLAYSKRRCVCEGLDGAEAGRKDGKEAKAIISLSATSGNQSSTSSGTTTYNVTGCYLKAACCAPVVPRIRRDNCATRNHFGPQHRLPRPHQWVHRDGPCRRFLRDICVASGHVAPWTRANPDSATSYADLTFDVAANAELHG